MVEPFDLKKAVDLSPSAIGKSTSVGLKFLIVLGLIFCVVYTIYTIFHKQPNQNIIVEKGGVATIIQKNAPKKFLIPFTEVGVEQKQGNNALASYIRVGIRAEF